MFRTAWTLTHLRGIPLRLHVSLLLVVPFIATSVAARDLPFLLYRLGIDPGALTLPPLALGLVVSVALFAGVLLHELGHALTALRYGARVRAITLMVLGGVTEIEHPDATARQRFWTALNGPLVSVAVGLGALALTRVPGLPLDAVVVGLIVGLLNLVIAVFNLLPAFPLDGGRVLGAVLERWLTPDRAVDVVAALGRVVAIGLVVWGVAVHGLMLVLIGAFVFFGAGAERRARRQGIEVGGLTARQAMVTRVATVSPDLRLAGVARHMLLQAAQAALVRDLDGVRGALQVTDLRIGAAETAGDLVDGEPLFVHVDAPLDEVVRAMRDRERPAIVLDHFNAVAGVVTPVEVRRAAGLKAVADADLPSADAPALGRPGTSWNG